VRGSQRGSVRPTAKGPKPRNSCTGKRQILESVVHVRDRT